MTENVKRYIAAAKIAEDRERESRAAAAEKWRCWTALTPEEEREADAIMFAPDPSEDVTVVAPRP